MSRRNTEDVHPDISGAVQTHGHWLVVGKKYSGHLFIRNCQIGYQFQVSHSRCNSTEVVDEQQIEDLFIKYHSKINNYA